MIVLKARLSFINSLSQTRSIVWPRAALRYSNTDKLLVAHLQFRVYKHKSLYNSRHLFTAATTSLRSPPLTPLCILSLIDPEPTQQESDGANPNATDEGSDRSVVSNGVGQNLEKKVLPEEFCRSVLKLTCESSVEGGECEVYVVGTIHVSRESCQEVEAVINFLKPQVVFLELCASRVSILSRRTRKVPTMGEMIDQWKKKNNVFGIFYRWFFAKVASKLEVFPDCEFRVAYEEAMKYGGKVILGDRPVKITLERMWGKMPLWHKFKILYSLVSQAILFPSPEHVTKKLKKIDDVDMTLVFQKVSKEFPTVMETIVHERDKYMSSRLLQVASEHSSVVAVVGKGHLQGIKKHWKQPVELNDLLAMPTRKGAISAVKILQTIGVTVAGVAIISGLYLSSKK